MTGCLACSLMLACPFAFAADPIRAYSEVPDAESFEALHQFIQRPAIKSHVAAWGLGVSDIRKGMGRLSSTELAYLARTLDQHPQQWEANPAADAMLVVMVSSLTRSMLFARVVSRRFGELSLPAPITHGDSAD